jgi:glutamate-5-semialdehyde dehydrogenase
MADLLQQLWRSRMAQSIVGQLSAAQRNAIIRDIAAALLAYNKHIAAVNGRDLKNFRGTPSLADRLRFDERRIKDAAAAMHKIARLPDPVGKDLEQRVLPNGLQLRKVAVPLGVVAVIYESRPNVTIDLVALSIKSGNAAVLKGGSDSYATNRYLVSLIHKILRRHRIPVDAVLLIDPRQEWKKTLLQAYGVVDVIVPRGGMGLIKFVREHSQVPVIETGRGVCHTFVDAKYDLKKAADIIVNAKVQRPGVCNALDTLVIHQKAAKQLLPQLAARLAAYEVEIRADRASYKILKSFYPANLLVSAKPGDFGLEFLSLIMSIKTVKSFHEGLKFVQRYTSGHSEAILTADNKHAETFLNSVDAAVVYHNASTRFTDGEEFGFGAEVGVSTQKLHARGPMGAETLTSYKWLVQGSGQVR